MSDEGLPRIEFRSQTQADEQLVRRAHVAHRAELLGGIDWPADALARLCDQQHELQERHIAAYHPHAERLMVIAAHDPVGRLCVDRSIAPWRIVDIALVPEGQNRGFGTAALMVILKDAGCAGTSVELQVERDNPRAEALYRRLAFVEAFGATATHLRMVWTPLGCSDDLGIPIFGEF